MLLVSSENVLAIKAVVAANLPIWFIPSDGNVEEAWLPFFLLFVCLLFAWVFVGVLSFLGAGDDEE